MRARVLRCRDRQLHRQGQLNSGLDGTVLQTHTPVADKARAMLRKAMIKLNASARATHRVLRVARTAADLDDEDVVEVRHIAEGIQYRYPSGR